ncbi:MAG: hypothetical protein ACKPKT_24305, partial [Dolichospermum sp.]
IEDTVNSYYSKFFYQTFYWSEHNFEALIEGFIENYIMSIHISYILSKKIRCVYPDFLNYQVFSFFSLRYQASLSHTLVYR